MRGRWLWRAAAALETGGGRAAPWPAAETAAAALSSQAGAAAGSWWWQARAGGVTGFSRSCESGSRRLWWQQQQQQPFWLHTAGLAHENSGDEDEGDDKDGGNGSSSSGPGGGSAAPAGAPPGGGGLAQEEVQALLRHVNVAQLRHKIEQDPREHMDLGELLEMCQAERAAGGADEAAELVRALHHAGALFVFRNRVFLRPERLAAQIARALPLELALEDDPRRDEFARLDEAKAQLDAAAHRKVRKNLLTGLMLLTAHFAVFFRLTFWDFSWDVMEPVAFFITTGALLAGYGYFLTTANDPSYQDMHHRLFRYHQRKLMKKHNFDLERYQFLATQCKSCFSHPAAGQQSGVTAAWRKKDD